MSYQTLVAIVVSVSMHASLCHAQTSDEQAIALLRASSTQSAIVTFCAKYYSIDGTTALRISQTARDVAAKLLGGEASDAAFKEELARRFAEVKELGEQQWCTDQRNALADGGAHISRIEGRV